MDLISFLSMNKKQVMAANRCMKSKDEWNIGSAKKEGTEVHKNHLSILGCHE